MHARVHSGRLNWCTRILVWTLHSLNPDLDFECGCVCPQTGQFGSSLDVVVLWAPFLWGSLLSFFVLVRVCAGDCVFWPFICFCLLWPSLFVGRPLASVLSLWSLFGVLRVFCLVSLVFGLFLLLPLFFVPCSVALIFCSWCLGLLRFGPLSPVAPSCPSPPWLVLWCLLVQSVFCWSLPPGIWLYLQRPGCPTFGMVCCPVWGSALYTMLWVLIRCLSLLH